MVSRVGLQRLTRRSATPGQKKKAYAQVLPQKATRLAGAVRSDIFSTTKPICAKIFWMKVFRALCWTDSARKSEELELNELEDLERVLNVDAVLEWNSEVRHSGLSMMPRMPSRIAGLSVPEIDWLLRPCSISSSPCHHLFSMLTRRSKSSVRNCLIELCGAGVRRKGSSAVRTTFAFKAMDFELNLNTL